MILQRRTPAIETRLEVRVRPAREAVWITPVGELDLTAGPELREQVAELVAVGFEDLVIDLRGLSFIDATGVALLLELAGQATARGWRLSFIPGHGQVQRILSLTGAEERLTYHDAHRSPTHIPPDEAHEPDDAGQPPLRRGAHQLTPLNQAENDAVQAGMKNSWPGIEERRPPDSERTDTG